MPRKKKAEFKDPLRIKELCLQYGVDPFEELIKITKETVRVPKDTPPELLKALLLQYRERYELVNDPKDPDAYIFKTKQAVRVQVFSDLTKYCYPQLKATENKVESDFKVTVVVRQFEAVEGPARTVQVVDTGSRPAIPEAVEVEVEDPEGSTDA